MYESPFNNWAKGLKASDLPSSQQATAGLFGEGFNIAGTDGAYYGQSAKGGTRVAIPGQVAGFKGLTQIGTSIFSLPASTVTPSGEIIDTTEAAYREMRAASKTPLAYRRELRARFPDKEFRHIYGGAIHRIEAIKEASQLILDTSRSTLSTGLGPDYSLAFHRSKMMNVLDASFNVLGEKRTLRDHLSHMESLVQTYQRSGGRDLTQKQAAIDKFYGNLVAAVEGSSIGHHTLSISGIKDKLFREHGVVSTMKASDITYGVSFSGLGKGYHQFAKLQPFHHRALASAGLSTPATSGAAFAEESRYVSKLMRFEGHQLSGKYSARFGADTFLSISAKRPGGDATILADSRSIAGRELYNLSMEGRITDNVGMDTGPQMATRHKTVLLGGAEGKAINSLEFHSEISDDMKHLIRSYQDGSMSVPKGMKRSSAGIYLYEGGAKQIGRQGYAGSDIDFFLGKSTPKMEGIAGEDDLKRALVGSGERQANLNILGYKMSSKGGGAIDILYEPARAPGTGTGFAERAMIIHGRRVMQRQSPVDLITSKGKSVHQVLRGQELGVGKTLGEDFFSALMSNWGEISRSQGKLGNMATFLGGHQLIDHHGASAYMALQSNEAGLGTNMFRNLSKVLSASPSELASIGLTKADVDVITQEGNAFKINPAALEDLLIDGEMHTGIRLRGLETAMRAGTVDSMKIGPGAMSMRLHDMIPMINEQMSAATPGSDLHNAYSVLHSNIKGRILQGKTGRIGSGRRSMPGAANELSSIYQSFYNQTTPFKGGVLDGIKGSSKVMDYGDWLSSGAKPLGMRTNQEAVKQLISGGKGFAQSVTEGTVHAAGYGGEVIRLPKAMKVALTDTHVINTSMIPMPSDRFLGSEATEYGAYISGSGIRGQGLVRKKALLAAIMHEESSTIAKGTYSPAFQRRFKDYMGALNASMGAKGGLVYNNLVGQPAGAFNSVITNWGSIGSSLTHEQQLMSVGMNPVDARELIKQAGYGKNAGEVMARVRRGEQKLFLNMARYPWHQGSNLGVMQLHVTDKVARDRIAVSERFAQVAKGDFDKDMMVGMLDKKDQDALAVIHKHRQQVMNSYDVIVKDQEKQQLAKIAKKVRAGELSSGSHFDDLLKSGLKEVDRAQIHSSMSARLGSAAGGGVYVGPVHMGWARLNALAQGAMEKEGQSLISTISSMDAQLGKQLAALSKDTSFLRLMGTTQETGVYGILKKGAKGFGTEQMSALSALVKYGEGGISLDEARSVMREGFTKAADQGLLETSELGGMKSATQISNALFSGEGHEGIGTLAKVKAKMRSTGVPDISYEVARGFDPTRRGAGLNYFSKRIMDTMFQLTGGHTPGVAGGPAEAEAFTRSFTQVMDEAAEGAPDVFQRGQIATEAAATPGPMEGMSKQIRGIMQSRWGKRIMIGAGVVLGAGALDALFGEDGQEEAAPQFVGGAPLPPRMDIGVPDAGIGMPSAEGFRSRAQGPARIERPIAQRSNYSISADAGDHADFSYMMGGYQGTVGAPPTRDGYITDNTRDMDIDYELRKRLRSSF